MHALVGVRSSLVHVGLGGVFSFGHMGTVLGFGFVSHLRRN